MRWGRGCWGGRAGARGRAGLGGTIPAVVPTVLGWEATIGAGWGGGRGPADGTVAGVRGGAGRWRGVGALRGRSGPKAAR